ncbi:Threonine dehydratase [Candidatus Rhodobacter oscarellae]|uniref:Threonine dehydratase n=1 Tax=Candidatus Rhodobacter oscarellae TaxID=1675527 RepID=A0A0J9EDW7_9RHOB|nr:pyridoxal-phosphate dependent enzyme [Candidatus Rhodobacter lobularis]KMW60821.1 Threonine dehydratase [Candidatus Rhodobacter lobularis]
MSVFENPHRGRGLPGMEVYPSVDAAAVGALLARCPRFAETPMVQTDLIPGAELWVKDESDRMGLGSFKALGAAYVIARDAEAGAARGRTYVAASAGNHGLSVAAGAAAFGAQAAILLSETVPESFAERLRGAGAVYEESMAAAMRMADENSWVLLSDSSWPGYTEIPYRVMEGYTQMAAECTRQIEAPTHIYLQAGVGGLACAVAAYARHAWGDGPEITVVEPEAAPALVEAIRAGEVVFADGPVSNMGRLDCKEASLVALAGLARDADRFMTVSDGQADAAVAMLAKIGLSSSPSGAAGLAGALAADLPQGARALVINSEGAA